MLKRLIENATKIHIDFWSQLEEASPDLVKLNETGSKINGVINMIEKHWAEMMEITENQPKSLRIYGKF